MQEFKSRGKITHYTNIVWWHLYWQDCNSSHIAAAFLLQLSTDAIYLGMLDNLPDPSNDWLTTGLLTLDFTNSIYFPTKTRHGKPNHISDIFCKHRKKADGKAFCVLVIFHDFWYSRNIKFTSPTEDSIFCAQQQISAPFIGKWFSLQRLFRLVEFSWG